MNKEMPNGGFSIFGQADEYFEKNVLPREIKGYTKTINRPTPYNHSHETIFVYVRSGTGTLTVNGLEYELKPNALTCLGPFHRYRYTPNPGQKLEIMECRLNSGAYVYLISNPYYKIKRFDVPSEPPLVYLKGFMKDIALGTVEGIICESDRREQDSASLLFCYVTDLVGLIYDGLARGNAAAPLE